MRVYHLWANTEEYSSLQQAPGAESISMLALKQKWHPFPEPLPQVRLELHLSDNKARNYRMDISSVNSPFIVFSVRLVEKLYHILDPRGQFIPVEMPASKRPFVGYYPTNPIPECVDFDRSTYEQFPLGKSIHRYVLRRERITDDWLFTADEGRGVFVTEQFRNAVEEHGLKGFTWRREVELV